MAEQDRNGRGGRGASFEDDRERGLGGGRERSRSDGGRGDSLFGSNWDEREERGWGRSGGADRSERYRDQMDRSDRGSSWFGGRDRDHDREPRRPVERGSSGGGWLSSGRGADERPGAYREPDNRFERSASRAAAMPSRHRDDRELLERERMDRERSSRERHGETSDRDERSRGYSRDERSDDLPVDETSRLIASNKVEGTSVYGLDGERLGSIYNFMVEKVAGKVEYAVMTYGGFLGMGTRYYPIPWRMLKYDTRRGGYRIDLTSRDLERAPSFDRSSEPSFDREYGERVHNWYGLNY